MKNLSIGSHTLLFLQSESIKLSQDFLNHKIYTISKDLKQIDAYSNDSFQNIIFESQIPLSLETSNENNQNKEILIKCFDYIYEQNQIIIITSKGNIYGIDLKTKNIEEIASLNEVTCASWSPTQDNLLISTRTHLILLDSKINPIKEIIIDPDDQNGTYDECMISWKADSKQVAVNIMKKDEGSKCIIYSIELNPLRTMITTDHIVQSVSQKFQKDLSNLCSFMPLGSLIAGFSKSNREIIFWEINGLMRGQIKNTIAEMIWLGWNFDSQVLAAASTKLVRLYMRQNYEWQLKLSLPLQNISDVKGIYWHPNYNLLYIYDNKNLEVFQLFSEHTTETLFMENNFRACALTLRLPNISYTFFSEKIIPPPFFQNTLTTNEENVSSIYMGTKFSNILYHFKLGRVDLSHCNIQYFDLPLEVQKSFFITGNDEIIWIIKASNPVDLIFNCEIKEEKLVVMKVFKSPSKINSIFSKESILYICSQDGTIYYIDNKGIQKYHITLSEPAYKFSIIDLKKSYLVSLSTKHNFYINNILICPSCISFKVHDQFLFMTVGSPDFLHKLYSLELSENTNINTLDEMEKEVMVRNVEKHSIIVISTGKNVILEMPRGNLETVLPRFYSLRNIGKVLSLNKYGIAFPECRRQRINLNIIFDYDVKLLLKNVEIFLNEVDKPEFIQLFVAELTPGLCNDSKWAKESCIQYSKTQEDINDLLLNLAKEMEKKDSIKYEKSIVSCKLKMVPPKIIEVLELLFSLKGSAKEEAEKSHYKDLLKFVGWMVKPDVLYKEALATYKLDVVQMVAEITQMDPKEYMPFIKQLSEKSEVQKRIDIHIYLQQYPKALQIMSTEENLIDESIKFVHAHKLYEESLNIFASNKKNLEIIQKVVAKYFLDSKRYLEAGNLFYLSKDYSSAFNCYSNAGKHQEALSMIYLMELKENELIIKINEYAETLLENGKFELSASIFKTLPDKIYINKAFDAYMKVGLFKDSFTLICQYKLESELKIKLIEAVDISYSIQLNYLLSLIKDFTSRRSRLKIVQQQKEAMIQALGMNKLPSIGSDKGSEVSYESRSSRSNKSKSKSKGGSNKKVRKNIKEGSPMEEELLIYYLKSLRLIPNRINEINELSEILSMLNKSQEAEKLKSLLNEFISISKEIIFPVGIKKVVETNEQIGEFLKNYID